jgi:tetratricopeptide (TPR) repeat protein
MNNAKVVLVGLLVGALVLGCSGPEEKKARFMAKGQALYEQGEYVSAALELKNALQIDPKFAEAHYRLGLVEVAQTNFRSAIGHLLKAIELDPTLATAHVELGKVYLGARLPEKALEEVETVLAADPANSEALLLKAAVWVAQEKFEQVRSYLEQLLADGLTAADGYLLLGAVYLQQGSVAQAEATIKRGLEANPGQLDLQIKLADLYQQEKRFAEAAGLLQEVQRQHPEKTELALRLALLHRQAGQTEQVEAVLEQFLAEHGSEADAWVKVAKFHLSGRQLDRALQVMQQGMARQPQLIELRLALAELILNSTRDNDKAMAILQEGLKGIRDQESPAAIQLKTALARLHYQRGDLKALQRQLQEVLQVSPKNDDALYLQGSLDLLQGKGDAAVAAFRAVVDDRPEFVDARIQLAEAHIMNREYNLAADTLRQGLGSFPGSRPLQRAYARLQARQGHYAEARAVLQGWLKVHPDDLQVLADTGAYHVAKGQLQEAKNIYGQLVAKAPKLPQGYLRLAGCLQREGRLAEALAEIERGVQVLPENNLLAEALVQLCLQQGQAGKAARFIEERLARHGDNAFDSNLQGEMLLASGQVLKARKAFEQAIARQPDWPAPYKNLAESYLRKGELKQAEQVFQRAIDSTERNVGAYQALSYLKQRQGERAAAIALLKQAIEIKPDFWPAANDIAFLLADSAADREDLDQALSLARRARNLASDDPSVLDTLGWVEYCRGNLGEAEQWLRQALAAGAVGAEVDYHMGMISFGLGRKEQAREYLEKALAGGQEFLGRDQARQTLEEI